MQCAGEAAVRATTLKTCAGRAEGSAAEAVQEADFASNRSKRRRRGPDRHHHPCRSVLRIARLRHRPDADLVGQDGGSGQTQTQAPRQQPAPTTPGQQQTAPRTGDEAGDFAKTVLAETEDVWTGIFKAQGATYQKPTLVLFNDQVRSACGFASAASGPFYCPGDRKLYIDLGFYDQLANQFGASGDFAQAYVLAHEVGHHVQNLIGVLPQFNEMRQRMNQVEANEMSTRVELQADCFAGVWGHFTAQKGLLDDGDIEEALNAAQQIGDDTLQRRTQGYVVPESFNHGTSKQRQTWFARGFKSGKLEDCDTFNSDI
jgi:predicted metalloprotease